MTHIEDLVLGLFISPLQIKRHLVYPSRSDLLIWMTRFRCYVRVPLG